MPSFEQLSSKFPKLQQYLKFKELAINEILQDRYSILNRRDWHLESIKTQLVANRELLLLLGHVVDEEVEGPVYTTSDETPK
jgi:hypothetical protein